MLDKICIVLVQTSHPGNIGAVARAMKTMGLSRLCLVQPKQFPSAECSERAAGADDILHQARVVDSLDAAIADCQWVIGTSGRQRSLPWPQQPMREAMQSGWGQAQTGVDVAVVFGPERMGLVNTDLQRCHQHTYIPSNPSFPALNLAAAVQVACYELRLAELEKTDTLPESAVLVEDYATQGDLTRFYEHLQSVLLAIGFLNPKSPRQAMPRLRRLFQRARLDTMELGILRGILSKIEKLLSP